MPTGDSHRPDSQPTGVNLTPVGLVSGRWELARARDLVQPARPAPLSLYFTLSLANLARHRRHTLHRAHAAGTAPYRDADAPRSGSPGPSGCPSPPPPRFSSSVRRPRSSSSDASAPFPGLIASRVGAPGPMPPLPAPLPGASPPARLAHAPPPAAGSRAQAPAHPRPAVGCRAGPCPRPPLRLLLHLGFYFDLKSPSELETVASQFLYEILFILVGCCMDSADGS